MVAHVLSGKNATLISTGSELSGKDTMVWGPPKWFRADTPDAMGLWGTAPRILRELFTGEKLFFLSSLYE